MSASGTLATIFRNRRADVLGIRIDGLVVGLFDLMTTSRAVIARRQQEALRTTKRMVAADLAERMRPVGFQASKYVV